MVKIINSENNTIQFNSFLKFLNVLKFHLICDYSTLKKKKKIRMNIQLIVIISWMGSS